MNLLDLSFFCENGFLILCIRNVAPPGFFELMMFIYLYKLRPAGANMQNVKYSSRRDEIFIEIIT